jgi:2-polyprenyl-3-methyl-5-hydroxy-6-metoxy-1,4-benzoquinol methylase
MPSAQLYEAKGEEYFGAVGHHILQRLPADAHRVLEFGYGSGATGAAAKARQPGLEWVGIELFPAAAAEARQVLDKVYEGDVASLAGQDLGAPYDVIVASEVLEHLVEPWAVVNTLAQMLRPGGLFLASSPNVANKDLVADLLRGRFDYQAQGVMDQTHLRWFTPRSFARMFSEAGLTVLSCEPLVPLRRKARLLDAITLGRLRHLFFSQMVLVARRD